MNNLFCAQYRKNKILLCSLSPMLSSLNYLNLIQFQKGIYSGDGEKGKEVEYHFYFRFYTISECFDTCLKIEVLKKNCKSKFFLNNFTTYSSKISSLKKCSIYSFPWAERTCVHRHYKYVSKCHGKVNWNRHTEKANTHYHILFIANTCLFPRRIYTRRILLDLLQTNN